MYHLEVRQPPHSACSFNLSEEQLRAMMDTWVRHPVVEMGERKWLTYQATVRILEGPKLELAQLSMGRGWRAAEREGTDVTARVLAAARQAVQGHAAGVGAPVGPAHAPGAAHGPGADALALGVQMGALLGSDPTRLLEAWRAVAARSPDLAPSEALAQAEQAIDAGEGTQG